MAHTCRNRVDVQSWYLSAIFLCPVTVEERYRIRNSALVGLQRTLQVDSVTVNNDPILCSCGNNVQSWGIRYQIWWGGIGSLADHPLPLFSVRYYDRSPGPEQKAS